MRLAAVIPITWVPIGGQAWKAREVLGRAQNVTFVEGT